MLACKLSAHNSILLNFLFQGECSMKNINSNIGTWILSSMGAIAIALSITVSLPTASNASSPGTCTAECANGKPVSCKGSKCVAIDGDGCLGDAGTPKEDIKTCEQS